MFKTTKGGSVTATINPFTKLANEWIEYRLALLDSVQAGPLHNVPFSDLPPQVQAELAGWHGRMIQPGRGPEDSPEVSYSVHFSTKPEELDVVRSTWSIGNVKLTAFDDTMFISIWSRPKDAITDEATARAAVERLAGFLLSHAAPFEAREPTSAETWAFSTAPTVNHTSMPFWFNRIEGGIHAGHVYLLAWKRKNQLIGFEGAVWFDQQFRQRLKKPHD
jgi:hypothetical protein